jgi:hypothetical protein
MKLKVISDKIFDDAKEALGPEAYAMYRGVIDFSTQILAVAHEDGASHKDLLNGYTSAFATIMVRLCDEDIGLASELIAILGNALAEETGVPPNETIN